MRDHTPKTITFEGTKYKVRYASMGEDGNPAFICDTDKLFGVYGDELPLSKVPPPPGKCWKTTDRDVTGLPTGVDA